MCGRYATTRGAAELGALFEADDDTGGLAPDYNVAPTDPVPVVRLSSTGERRLATARWGLVPHWAPDPGGAARMINARAETVATSRAFARSFAGRRCLIPADGWYEWVRRDGGKQPYFMTPHDGSVLAFAGLWSVWSGPPGSASAPLLTCSIITRPAIGELAGVHDRMPLVLPAARWPAWLAGGGEPETLLAAPDPATVAGIEIRPVGRAVGDVRNDGPGLVARIPVPEEHREAPVRLTLF
ncbi:SOS response-associated peptidase [Plantactinospora siamensis]|uniref:Abasic site processing protein n=1 Tax=Plantactinospora siamensis TaxID=555372 RepID=A0ABV6NY95_9ACTN